ncbi:MAG: aminotransferase class I/II-fold pyridoxal phosphate-dependent enzyme [Cyclobacteriaceae bacterium]|nr:aminotransferase class I/II-fold pyridoxal phosphate-dependent enzyme [Cyclobacteriaceae bacterium]QOI97392.1 MAG: aminotransferase class I/II-fold pyridoxal phosphate-dependent enzyme [Flammeovirgaceae bacterium]
MIIEPSKRVEGVEEYYFSRKLAEVRKLDTPEYPVINLGIGSPDLPPAPAVIETLMVSAMQAGHHGYQSYRGVAALRNAIASFSERVYGTVLNAETMILPLMGSKEGIMHISMAFLNEGDEVLVPDPGYPTYAAAARLAGATVRTYDLSEENDWRVDIQSLRKQDLSNVKIMWLNSPHMPTGATASVNELKELVTLAREHQFLLVNDNPYSLILNDTPISLLSVDGALEVALELNSLSKSHNMAGWRVGWVAGRKEYIDAILRFKSNMDSGMFLAVQHAAAEALRSAGEWTKSLNTIYRKRRQVVYELLNELRCTYTLTQAGLFVWAKAPDDVPAVEQWLDEILYEAHVFITPGFVFGKNGGRYIRVSLCNPEEQIQEAVKRISAMKIVKQKQVSAA